MKNKDYTILLVFLILLTAFLCSCKKYKDNPLIVLSSKESRLCQKWTCTEMYNNGKLIIQPTFWISVKFNRDNTFISDSNLYPTITGNYQWNKEKTVIYTPHLFDEMIIIKLTNKEFWFISDCEYHFHLK